MANKPLDSATCKTAADAFKSPLPQVRQFHRSLTSELDQKNARLRTLVGGSYRQLLGTAEMILQMRDDIGAVEDKLGRVGSGCGRGVVGDMAKGLGRLQGSIEDGPGADKMRWVARVKALDMCAVVVGRLLKNGGGAATEVVGDGSGRHLIVAAKVLVLSRLLAKSLSDSASIGSKDESELVEQANRKLENLRRRFRRVIERTLMKIDGDDGREELSQALCAYSLATSSGTKDVLRYFLRVRREAMILAFEEETGLERQTPGILRALKLYTRTLLDVQALIPRRLAEDLANLKTKPLLKDETVRKLEGLRLDICERWFGDQILFFIPYIRHDDLEGPQALDTLKSWAKETSGILIDGFGKTLQRVTDFKTAVELRTKSLEVWIKEGGKAKAFDPSPVLDGLRTVINDCMVHLLESRVAKLHLVGTEIEGTLGAWRPGTTDQNTSLWDDDLLEMQISNGASSFKKSVLARTHGRSDAVSRVIGGYQTWRHLADEIITVLDQLKKQRWDDDLEDIEDDASIESRNALLSKDDPQMLQEHLDASLEKAYTDLHEKISTLLETYKDSEHIGQMSTYTLRILRDIRSDLPKNASVQFFGLALISPLHRNLAALVSADSVERLLKSFHGKNVPGRALWEGNPELPVQSSPGTFRFLHGLNMAMASMGSDLWSPAAVRVLKGYLRSELGSRWNTALEVHGDKGSGAVNGIKTNGVEASGDPETEGTDGDQVDNAAAIDPAKRKDTLTQSLFDLLFLKEALEATEDGKDGLQTIRTGLQSQIDLEPSSQKRLQQSAKEFWKRTSLLFGLLA